MRMCRRFLLTGLSSTAVLASVCVGNIVARVTAEGPPPALRDGAYSSEQAARGDKLYAAECASCHGSVGEGGDQSPPLNGTTFIANWSGLTLGDLMERIRTTMPQENPGKLTRQEDADVIAFLLKLNGFPAGTAELPKDTPTLKLIKIEPPNQERDRK